MRFSLTEEDQALSSITATIGDIKSFSPCFPHLETSMSPLDYALHPHIPALQRAQNVTPHLYNTDYYITKLNRLNIICLLKHSLVSSTIVISVVSTFNIALAFLNLYAMLLYCEI